jgi:hypothetical protein
MRLTCINAVCEYMIATPVNIDNVRCHMHLVLSVVVLIRRSFGGVCDRTHIDTYRVTPRIIRTY